MGRRSDRLPWLAWEVLLDPVESLLDFLVGYTECHADMAFT
jgi:hypothetical protein